MTGRASSFTQKRSKMGVVFGKSGRGLKIFVHATRAKLDQNPLQQILYLPLIYSIYYGLLQILLICLYKIILILVALEDVLR